MIGRRTPDGEMPERPGEYGRVSGRWFCCPPHRGFPTGDLSKHTVVEHGDRTITVADSILMTLGDGRRFHGYLVRGEWNTLGDSVLTRPRRDDA
jgi:hypothetical protein